MKTVLSYTKTTILLLLVTVLFLGFYVYMLARPISYGMIYHNEIVYDGIPFEGALKFYPDGRMINKNSNFDEEMTGYYYYKNGYVFTLLAETAEEYEAEVAYINENFEQVVASPFSAAKINAFKQVAQGLDNYVNTYTCGGAIIFAAAGGVILLAMITLTARSFTLSKGAKDIKSGNLQK